MQRTKHLHSGYKGALWIVAVSLPWPIPITSIALILLGLVWLIISGITRDGITHLRRNPAVWAFVALYMVYVVGLLYSSDSRQGLFVLEKMIPLVLLPLVMATSAQLQPSDREDIGLGFVFSCLIASALCGLFSLYYIKQGLAMAGQNFDMHTQLDFLQQNPDASGAWQTLSYIQLGRLLQLHPTFFSLYAVLAILIAAESQRLRLYAKLLLSGYFAVVILLFSSRMGTFALLASGSVLILRHFLAERRPVYGVAMATSFVLVVVVLTWVNPVSRFRLWQEPFQSEDVRSPTSQTWTSIRLRFVEWEAGMRVIAVHFPFGTGTGGVSGKLNPYYEMLGPLSAEYNTHNQFIETTAEVGLLGLGSFVACLGICFQRAIRQGQFILLMFLAVFTLFCMTESMLARQKGIVCFSYFTSLFLFAVPKS